ncbi:MAG: SCP2 sterol-binding domain-containing protein [Thermoleophilaceae bacterium]|nr:SCP2 sterol-binding domain-containing protein [Thermoleophilaceae bacterium]
MKFARLISELTVDAAIAAVDETPALGFESAWLIEEGDLADPRLVAGAARGDGLKLVLQLDVGADATLPPGRSIELAVDGSPGWTDALRTFLRESGDRPDPPVWVMAADVGTVAAAGRSGVGVAFAAREVPEEAAEWVDEYEAELSSGSAQTIADAANARLAVLLPAGDDPDELVGLVERYRQIGVDEVILSGPSAGSSEFVRGVIAEFDDDEVRAAVAEKAARLAPAVAAATDRATNKPAVTATPTETSTPPRKKKRNAKMARRVQLAQEGAVRKMSDRQLELIVGNRFGIRGLFTAMAAKYRPTAAGDFAGPIEFTLETSHGPEVWTINCSPTGAKARREPSPEAKLHVEAKLADFLRVGVGEIAAPSAVLTGKLNVRGDFGLALKLGPMFGGPAAM